MNKAELVAAVAEKAEICKEKTLKQQFRHLQMLLLRSLR